MILNSFIEIMDAICSLTRRYEMCEWTIAMDNICISYNEKTLCATIINEHIVFLRKIRYGKTIRINICGVINNDGDEFIRELESQVIRLVVGDEIYQFDL